MQDEVTVTQADEAEIAALLMNYGIKPVPAALVTELARHQAERETLARMEPVAWMYARGEAKHVVRERVPDLPAFTEAGWTETPLYALPPAPEAGQ
ncbi:hypothetical protein C7W88_12740 [Novosphingobium sp. THN1]|uniref:hypothetical protein n=1 Tax=Novosphingobium sp. THN1 TaxID=1016987 RepID=UPI000E503DE2|nr:hypothetical protein [Novosphingobium sp. THN1]AXU19692.1 hypothetical protein C7W88_12740 [Novosphingobium sp. THN1]